MCVPVCEGGGLPAAWGVDFVTSLGTTIECGGEREDEREGERDSGVRRISGDLGTSRGGEHEIELGLRLSAWSGV